MEIYRIFRMFVVLAMIAGSGLPAFAQEKSESAEKAIDEEMKWLKAEAVVITEIATKTGMDADLVPGMVTVLIGKDLEKQGFRTVSEALVLVPGVDLVSSMSGSATNIIRGITSSAKIKMLLNGVPMNSTMEGLGGLLDMGIAQVERIEVIRGPGSCLYGEWAYMGVINVMTYQKGNRIFTSAGSYDSFSGGIRTAYESDDKTLQTSLNIAGDERDRSDVSSGPDMFGREENINDEMKSYSAILSLNYRKLSLTGQWTESRLGNYFGLTSAIPLSEDENLHSNTYKMLEARLRPDISQHLSSEIKFGCREYIWDSGDFWLFPAGVITPYDSIGASYYKEHALYGGILFHWSGWQKQNWLIGTEYEDTRMKDVWMKVNYDPLTYEPVAYQTFTGEKNWLDEDKSRKVFGFFMQDQIDITGQIAVTAGLRYDRYDDEEYSYSRMTPRIAGVFRATDRHIFKFQYAEAFRPPSFTEMYSKNNPTILGNPELDFESVKTSEAEYIYRTEQVTGRLVAFYSEMDNLIYAVKNIYSNHGDARSKGIEAELNWKIADSLTFNANLSYADAQDKTNGGEMKNSPNWLSNAGMIWQIQSDWTAALNHRYVDNRSRGRKDPRESLDSYDTLNLTVSKNNLFYKGMTLRCGVKNLFDADIRYPANYSEYKEDYPQTGREWWIRVSYDF